MDTGLNTGVDPVVETAIGIATRRGNDQQATIDRLNALTTLDWIVNAEAMVTPNGTQVWTFMRCSIDWDHGHGTVALPDQDLLCPDCAERIIRAALVADARVDAWVLL